MGLFITLLMIYVGGNETILETVAHLDFLLSMYFFDSSSSL